MEKKQLIANVQVLRNGIKTITGIIEDMNNGLHRNDRQMTRDDWADTRDDVQDLEANVRTLLGQVVALFTVANDEVNR